MKMAAATGASNTPRYACSKCYTRHPFEELSQGQQLCKECRGSFPVVKCTYCRSEFQQESKSSTSSICKKCEQNVQKYGKPTSCQYCNIIAAFVNGKCHRCHDSYRRYGPPKTCEQCKQKCAFDKEDKKKLDGKLLCWLCSLSYKRALVRTKQTDPTRHSRVFKSEKEKKEKEKRDKYFNHKKPQRPDVTKIKPPRRSSSEEPLAKIAKKRDRDSDTDHVAEITQLKEKIAAMQRTITSKNNELLGKAGEITAMKAKLFNEEKLIKEKMKKMQKAHEDKVNELNKKINSLNTELSKVKREAANNKALKAKSKANELFPGANKKDLIAGADLRPKAASRTDSPAAASQGSRSQSPSPSRSRSRSRSPRSRSRSNSRSRSGSPASNKEGDAASKNNNSDGKSRSVSRSSSRNSSRSRSRSRSPSPETKRVDGASSKSEDSD